MSLLQPKQRTPDYCSLLIYRPRKDERLSWPSWLTYSGWFTHISGHPSAAGRAHDSESTPARDRRSTDWTTLTVYGRLLLRLMECMAVTYLDVP